MKSRITTHVLDTSRGVPAKGIRVTLEKQTRSMWKKLGTDVTDADGRCNRLLSTTARLSSGAYRLTFKTGSYFRASRRESFHPSISIVFHVKSTTSHYHVPLLLSPYGYTTYRGS